jgi:hypothetical protein
VKTYDRTRRVYLTGWAAFRHEVSIVVCGILGGIGMIIFACVVNAIGNGSWQ